jgi:hypothetical protein
MAMVVSIMRFVLITFSNTFDTSRHEGFGVSVELAFISS